MLVEHRARRRCGFRFYTFALGLLLAGFVLTPCLDAHERSTRDAHDATAVVADQLAIQIQADRLTLSVTDVPQVYLFGTLDAGAPRRFEALVQAGKIPHGSDVYLNSADGDVPAGLALGRLFRAGGMVTHLGKPPKKGLPVLNAAVCEGACAYAYLGGLYRWAPTGHDRIGFAPVSEPAAAHAATDRTEPSPGDVAAYLTSMGIHPDALAAASGSAPGAMLWPSADQMTASGLANNGRLPPAVSTQSQAGGPLLTLDQPDRRGDHRLTIACHPGSITLTVSNTVGAARAQQIVQRGARSYFELNRKEILTEPDGARADGDAVVISRPFPPARLEYVIFAQSVGAWVADQKSAFRAGFDFDLLPVRPQLHDFYNACWQAAPWPHTAGEN